MPEYPYFVGNAVLQSAYFQFPFALISDERFSSLSWLDKMTYVLLLDKARYYYRLGRLDEEGRPVIDDFTRKDIESVSGCSERTAARVFKALQEAGLIEVTRVSGYPSRILLKDFTSSDTGEYSYLYQDTIDTYRYVMIPQAFFTEEAFRDLPFASRILYGVLFSRVLLSARNGKKDEEGRIYIYYTMRNLSKDLSMSAKTVVAAMEGLEAYGLVTTVRDEGRPSQKIYVHNIPLGKGIKSRKEGKESKKEETNGKQDPCQTGNSRGDKRKTKDVPIGKRPVTGKEEEAAKGKQERSQNGNGTPDSRETAGETGGKRNYLSINNNNDNYLNHHTSSEISSFGDRKKKHDRMDEEALYKLLTEIVKRETSDNTDPDRNARFEEMSERYIRYMARDILPKLERAKDVKAYAAQCLYNGLPDYEAEKERLNRDDDLKERLAGYRREEKIYRENGIIDPEEEDRIRLHRKILEMYRMKGMDI